MAEKTCNTCKANKVCDHNKYGFENCNNYISPDVEEVCRCKECANGYNKTNVKVVCKIWRRVMLPEDYCSYGAKKWTEVRRNDL